MNAPFPNALEPVAAPSNAAPFDAAAAHTGAHPRRWWLEPALLLAICAIGLAVRVYDLRTIPPGLYNDEAAYAIDARAVLNGVRPVFFEGNSGREPLFIYLLAAAFALFGDSPYTVRLTAALIGALTVPATWFMVRAAAHFAMANAYGRQSAAVQRMAPWMAPWVSLLLALSYWHLSLSRLGYRAITLPLILAIASTFLFRTLRRLAIDKHLPWSDIVLTGFFAGLSFYTYMAARIAPVLIVLSLGFSIALAPRMGLPRRKMVTASAAIIALMVATMLPLLVYFARHPYFFAGHAFDISVFNGRFTAENPAAAVIQNAGKFFLMFFTLPDPDLRNNPSAQPVFDVVMGLWMCAGILLGIVNWRRFTLFYFVLWSLILAVPSMLSASSLPSSLRAVGMMPGVFVLPVAAMLWAGARVAPGHPQLALLAPLPFVLMSGILGVRAYFSAFATAERFDMPFLVAYVELGEAVRAQQGDDLWLVPLSAEGVRMENRFETVHYIVNNPERFRSITIDPATVSAALQSVTAGVKQVNVMELYGVTRFEINTSFLDNKQILDFLLARDSVASQPQLARADALATTGADGLPSGWIPYDTYILKESTDFSLPPTLRPADIRFADSVQLVGIATGSAGSTIDSEEVQLHGDERLWAVLEWKAMRPIGRLLKSSLVLLDADGQAVAQVDKMLTGDLYPAERIWDGGETTRTYHLLRPLPGTPPGTYTLAISVYEDESGSVYPGSVAGGAAALRARLGEVTLLPPLTAPQISPEHPLADVQLSDELELAGYDLPRTKLSPGETLGVTLYWQAMTTPTRDFTAAVELVDEDGAVAAHTVGAPGGSSYATTAWTPGFAVRDARTLLIAPEVPAGSYALRVRLLDSTAPVGVALLGEVTIEGRSRRMTPPQIELPLSATFGDHVRLLGVNDLPAAPLKPGATLPLTFIWQALRTKDAPLVRSVQLLDTAGVLVAQQDGVACAMDCPSTSWLPNEYLVDVVTLAIPAQLPPGSYQIIAGWYDANSLQRLPALDAMGAPFADNMAPLPNVVVTE